MNKIRVLFICTGNAARSQMAEAFLKKYAGDKFEVYSAGLDPKGINPYTKKVMEEIGIDISDQYSKSVRKYMGKVHIGYMITVCEKAERLCPIFPGVGVRLFWPFDDPAAVEGTDQEKTEKFREIRDQVETKAKSWLEEMRSEGRIK
jgi:arsenate reductase